MNYMKWHKVSDYLENGECGDWVKSDDMSREVEVANMIGGRYLLWDEEGVAGLTDDVSEAVSFLRGSEELTVEEVREALEDNGWGDTIITCPDGAKATVSPCGWQIQKVEDCEYFLIYWDIPWGGENKIETLVSVLNRHAELAKEQEDEKVKIRAYFDEHQKKGWDDDSWSWYSDWHKDVFGFRPHARVCGEYV